jgi:hypothetical protein
MDRLLRDLRAVSPRLASFCERIEPSARALALNVSNVPGPREPVAICGAHVGSLHSIAEIAEHHAVRVAAVSLCDELFLGSVPILRSSTTWDRWPRQPKMRRRS